MLRRPELKCKKPRTPEAVVAKLAKRGAQEIIAQQKSKSHKKADDKEASEEIARAWLEFKEDE